ncbi:MAG: hypothetical protein AAGC71_04945 [Pseudomonadota bacterium]
MNDDVTSPIDRADALWQAALQRASLTRHLKDVFLLVFGLTPWLRNARLESLRSTELARWLQTELAAVTPTEAAKVATLARINREMADTGFRQVVVANVTVPVAILAVLNEVLDGGVVRLAYQVFETKTRLIVAAAACFAAILAAVLYSYAVAITARNLHMAVQLARPDVAAAAESGPDPMDTL